MARILSWLRISSYLAFSVFLGLATPSLAAPDREGTRDSGLNAAAAPNRDDESNVSNHESLTDAQKKLLQEAMTADAQGMPETIESRRFGPAPPPSLSNLDISLILDVASAYFTSSNPLQTGAHDPNKTGFTLQQLEMHIASNVDQNFEFQANIVFAEFGVEIEEAYARTLALPHALQLRVGQFLLPFGRLNTKHPHAWHFLDQAIILGKFMGSEGGRGLGIETSWLIPLPWYSKLTVGFSQPSGQCCSRSFFSTNAQAINGIEDLLGFGRIEQFWDVADDVGLLLGGSQVIGENKSGIGNLTQISGADLMIRYRPLGSVLRRSIQLQVEWLKRSRQLPRRVLNDQGGYAELVATWSPNWSQGIRYEWGTGNKDDPLDPDWQEGRRRTTAQLTWFPSHFSRLRGQIGHDMPEWRSKPIWSVMLALEVLVGAHGAHDY